MAAVSMELDAKAAPMTRPEKIAEKLGARKQASLKTAKSTEVGALAS